MTEFEITDEQLTGVKGKVVIVTGGSSGIGLATVELLKSLGALIVSGDLQNPPNSEGFEHIQTDVRDWSQLVALFKHAKSTYGRIDCVFANAGIGPRADYLSLGVDEQGDPREPNGDTLVVNLNSVVNTVTLACHYMKSQKSGGAIVIMGSSTGLSPVRAIDYSTAKSGILGLGRGFARLVEAAGLSICINTLAPSWTATQVLPDLKSLLAAVSEECQPASVVARAAVYLMAEKTRHGDVIFVNDGKYSEIEKTILAPAYDAIKGDSPSDDAVLAKVYALLG